MKILLLWTDPFDRDIENPLTSGGMEKFCKLVYANFDVFVYKIPESERKDLSHVEHIINKAEDVNADVILSNHEQALFCGSKIQQGGYPLMMMAHNYYPMVSLLGRYNNAYKRGHSIFFVSEKQKIYYDSMAKRTKQKCVPISGYFVPSYCEYNSKLKKSDLLIEYECGTIGRCNKRKNPFIMKYMLEDTGISNLVITQTPSQEIEYYPSEDTIRYYNKQLDKNWDNVLWDLPHDKVFENISKCKTYFSTWSEETYGITALEALSCGVPIILNCDKYEQSASEIIPVSTNHFKKIPHNNKELLIKSIKEFDNIDRKEIQDMTYEKYNINVWKSLLSEQISMTIDRYKKINTNLMKFL